MLNVVVAATSARDKIRDAVRSGKLTADPAGTLAERGVARGIIDAAERDRLTAAERARDSAVQVDAYDPDVYAGLKG